MNKTKPGTGRRHSSVPNLQSLPIRSPEVEKLRRAFSLAQIEAKRQLKKGK